MNDILILVGTQTGNAESLSEDLKNVITHVTGKSVGVKLMDDLDASVFDEGKSILICSSTWGDGELPDNALEFHKKCESEGATRMKGKAYANCLLGDHEYDPYFCEAGKIWDTVFQKAGAKKACDNYTINQGPEDDDIVGAMKWAVKFAESLA